MDPNHKIKPLLKHHIRISNFDNYQDFFRKRYKSTLYYEFEHSAIYPKESEKHRKPQASLLKVLKLATKSVKSIDLLKFRLGEYSISQPLELSIIKRLTRTSNISIKSYHHFDPSDNFVEKRFKYLTGVRSFTYEVWHDDYASPRINETQPQTPQKSQNLLRYLKLCPKIQSIIIKLASKEFPAHPNCFYDFKQYPPTLKYLSIEPELKTSSSHPCSSIKPLKQLQSIHLNLGSSEDYPLLINDSLSDLPQLQELSLKFKKDVLPVAHPTFKKIAEKGLLKKLSLSFDYDAKDFEQVLEAFAGLQLQDFFLKAYLFKQDQLIPIHRFLQRLSHLESLELNLEVYHCFEKADCLGSIYQEINKNETLRHLRLRLKAYWPHRAESKLTNLIPQLKPIFTKPIQLRTFHLECNQMDTSSTLFSLIEVVKPDALHSLEILMDDYSPNKPSQVAITNFVQTLQNIRVLKLHCFKYSVKKFLTDMAEAIQPLKHLRELQLGLFAKGTITRPALLEAVELILKKSGLESFDMAQYTNFDEILWGTSKKNPPLNLKQILKANPSLNDITSLSSRLFDKDPFGFEDWQRY